MRTDIYASSCTICPIFHMTHMRQNSSQRPLKLLAKPSPQPASRAMIDPSARERRGQSKIHHKRGGFLLFGDVWRSLEKFESHPGSFDGQPHKIELSCFCFCMKRIILFEGIASSGKTTLERMLNQKIEGSVLVTEGKTLMPIFEEKDPRAVAEHLFNVLEEIREERAETVIVDRFHLTQTFRACLPLAEFHALEKQLCEIAHSLLVLLSIREEAILNRIKETDEHRAGNWVKKKPGTYEERTEYYKEQQRILKQRVKESGLAVLILDTTDKNWDRCLNEILVFIGSDPPILHLSPSLSLHQSGI